MNIEGAVSLALLESAIKQTAAANEIPCSTIGLDPDGNTYYRPSKKPLYTLHLSEEPWETSAARQQSIPSNLEEGSLLDCFVVKMEPDVQLLLVAHHLAGDGLSMALLVPSYWTNRGIRIAHQCVEGEKAKPGIAVSVRPEGCKEMGYYAPGISVRYQYNKHKDFSENAQAIQKKTHSDDVKYFLLRLLQGIDSTLIGAAYFAAYDGYDNLIAKRMQSMFGYHGKPAQIGLSNLMQLPTPFGLR